MARALGTRPKVVLLDEPAAGLDDRESAALGERFRDVLDHGISILLIDHDMGLVLNVCDYLYVLEFGDLIAEGTPAECPQRPTTSSPPTSARAAAAPSSAHAIDGEVRQ